MNGAKGTAPAGQVAAHLLASDRAAGFEVVDAPAHFSQMNGVFTCAFWDDRVRFSDSAAFFASYRMEAAPRRGDSFTQKDFALRNAAWLIRGLISERAAGAGLREGFQGPIVADTPVAPERAELGDQATEAAEIKAVARAQMVLECRNSGPTAPSACGFAHPPRHAWGGSTACGIALPRAGLGAAAAPSRAAGRAA